MREPRSQTIWDAVRRALRATGMTQRSYFDAVVAEYHAATALHDRTVDFHTGSTAAALDEAMGANAQLLHRMMAGEVRTPADLEEALVAALPEPHRRRLLSDLVGRYGLLPTARPALGADAQQGQLADLLLQVGEAAAEVAGMLADGQIDTSDRPKVRVALRELDDVIAAALALEATLEAATRGPVGVSPMRRAS